MDAPPPVNPETLAALQQRRADLLSQKADVEQELATLKNEIRACNILKSAQDKRAADERKVAGAKTNLDNIQRAVRKGHVRPGEIEVARTAVAGSGVLVVPSELDNLIEDRISEESGVRDRLVAYLGGNDPGMTGSPLSTVAMAEIVIARAAAHDNLLARIRPQVLRLAEAMEERLKKNEWKGGWHTMTATALFKRLGQEIAELRRETKRKPHPSQTDYIRHEAADVANFAMMIADVCGALGILAGK